LEAARLVAPELTRLGQHAAPVLARVQPTTLRLSAFAHELNPVSTSLAQNIGPLLGVIEGWARTIQMRDGPGHVFRTHITLDSQLLTSALGRYAALFGVRSKTRASARPGGRMRLPALSGGNGTPLPVPGPQLAKGALPVRALAGISHALGGVLQTVGHVGQSGPGASPPPASSGGVVALLNYLPRP
jgi:hypothetical protein